MTHMAAGGEVNIRPCRADDERGVLELFQQSFGHPLSGEHWRWKLHRQPSAVDNVWLATADDKPIFHYAGIPTRFLLSQTPVTVMVSVDTMTAPEFRRRGLLTRVAAHVYSAWRAADVAFVMGLPNQQWGSRAAALGWQPLFPLQWLVRPLLPEALLARRLKLPVLERLTAPTSLWHQLLNRRLPRDVRVQTTPVDRADEVFDQLWERCRPDWMFSTVRDSAWIGWRFLSAPARSYEITLAWRAGVPTGYAAHCLISTPERTTAYLADLFVGRSDSATRDSLLREVIEVAREARAEALLTLAIPGTPLFRRLRQVGFFPRHTFMVQLLPLRTGLPLDLMRDPNHWSLAGADFDVV
jgi:Acetyltransferase (GNAT) domain